MIVPEGFEPSSAVPRTAVVDHLHYGTSFFLLFSMCFAEQLRRDFFAGYAIAGWVAVFDVAGGGAGRCGHYCRAFIVLLCRRILIAV